MSDIKRIGVLTSGGDSPGMNAAVRAVVRTGIYEGLEVMGIYRGYNGLIHDEIISMDSHMVSNIIQQGGTILKSARSMEFMEYAGREKAYANLLKHNIDALVVIGGDGTFTGANYFINEFDFPIVGLPGTIDNDLFGTDSTIGYDTAVNTVVEAVDKIRDTADSHERLFIIEVMGRDAGFIALRSGISTGAEAILVPESHTYIEELMNKLRLDWKNKKTSGIIIVAEGDDFGGAIDVKKAVNEEFPNFDTRVTILGHIQRGGRPTAFDRVLASSLGYSSVKALLEGKRACMIGLTNKKISYTPFAKSIKHNQKLNEELLNIANVLSSIG